MIRSQILRTLALALLATATLTAGEFNKKRSIGDAAPVWKDLEGTDGQLHALADLKDKDAVVVVFTCNSCLIAVDYEDRIIAFAKKHAGPDSKIAVVAVNVNTIKVDQLPKMKERAEKKKLPYAYLYDPSQEIAKAYGATYTPEFFVLNKERKIVYMGAFDDKTNAEEAKVNHIEAALLAITTGKPVEKAETIARGCQIRFNRDGK